jgi:flavin reductase (DIM6/NTAB) family NADH-FMN oxidoreductase RutF
MEVDIDSFRAAMRELASGVVVVTVGKDQDITGFTATSFASLSAHPPRLLVCVDKSSASWLALQRHSHFGVNILRDEERALANRFAGWDGLKGSARYVGARWTTMLTGTPILENALAALDCEVEEMLPRYDHSIVIGRVRAATSCPGSHPLVYWQRDYIHFSGPRQARDRVSRTDRDALAEPTSNQLGLQDHPMATLRKKTGNEDERI